MKKMVREMTEAFGDDLGRPVKPATDSLPEVTPSNTRPTPSRVVIEAIEPKIDDGCYPVKRIKGDHVTVTADIFADAHDAITAVLRHRLTSGGPSSVERPWQEVGMRKIGSDRWSAEFQVDALGTYEFTVAAWIDDFETWRQRLEANVAAGQVTNRELQDGAVIVRNASERARPSDAASLETVAQELEGPGTVDRRIAAGLDGGLRTRLAQVPAHHPVTSSEPLQVQVERQRARFGAWYEMFPRSAGTDPTRSATFDEAAERLPDIAAMGFNVLYLPPIHPIGLTGRKGQDNSHRDGPGSPWAIGGPAGGHFAIEPGLGTLDDFDRFVARADAVGLEIALDLAFHCSPDHPYVREHPNWFSRHADGKLRRSENPPKCYDDICPFDFDGLHLESLYDELHRIVAFWIGHGVKVFRADNPHTKPFAFWEWLIRRVRCEHPDVVFLAESFTRPKVMRRLAKLGFSQSYTYFIWRNTKAELSSYFQELTTPPVREYLRPNLFINTPDILPKSLQTGGRAAFEARLVLAGTLGANYGIYSGFELCEDEAVPDTEEYRHSEKFEYRARNWQRLGHIKPLVTRLNEIRHEHRALQADWSLRFHDTDDEAIICYSKTDDGNIILVAVTLDPHRPRSTSVELPPDAWGISPEREFVAYDLLDGTQTVWTGRHIALRFDPTTSVARIWRIAANALPLDRPHRKFLQ